MIEAEADVRSTVTIILIITFGIHACPNRVFAEVQYATSVLKVVVLLIFIFTSAAMIGGAGPTGKVHNGEYYRELPPFLHNVKVCKVHSLCCLRHDTPTDTLAGYVPLRYLCNMGCWRPG